MQAETRSCQNCKESFTIEPEDFAFYDKMKVPPPTWCPECRLIRRLAFDNLRTIYSGGRCAKCSKGVIVSLPPKQLSTPFIATRAGGLIRGTALSMVGILIFKTIFAASERADGRCSVDGPRNKEFCYFNEQLTKEDCERRTAEFRRGLYGVMKEEETRASSVFGRRLCGELLTVLRPTVY